MRVVLEVIAGPAAGRKIVLTPGGTVSIGRSANVTFPLSEDKHLSGRHFELIQECGECRLRDLASRNGTYVNDSRVPEAVLKPSDEIVAGSSRFKVDFVFSEEMVTTPAVAATTDQINSQATTAVLSNPKVVAPATAEAKLVLTDLQSRLLNYLRAQPRPVYALVDSARDGVALGLLYQSQEEHQILYEGDSAEKLADYGPYLVSVPTDSKLLPWLIHFGWGKSWGVYFTSPVPFTEARAHLRRFLMIETDEGRQLYFRFYDPRVLRSFLPKFTLEEAKQFFGPISSYLVEGENPKVLLRYSSQEDGVKLEKVDLLEPNNLGIRPAQE
jgi:pSer/pThr/pTyr-binding forkhead associated (FHA) protein